MKCDIPAAVTHDSLAAAEKYDIDKVILFGSQARGNNRKTSDIDLAVSGDNDFEFYSHLEEDAWTLLKFDVARLDKNISPELSAEIEGDGVLLCENAKYFFKLALRY